MSQSAMENIVCKNKIAVLMSAYNGEKYIAEQIKSIIHQTNQDWELFIRDDGSSDSTIKIIKDFISEKIHLIKDNVPHRGVTQSFLFLLKRVNAEYYMFCDQDDFWLPFKIEHSINCISQLSSMKSTMIFTDVKIVDESLNTIEESMWRVNKMQAKIRDLESLFISDFITGCTVMFNNLSRIELLRIGDNKFNLLHDQLLAIAIIKSHGQIKPLEESTMLYRQHNDNVVGAKEISNVFFYRIKNLIKLLNRDFRKYKTSKYYYKIGILKFIWMRLKYLNL